MIDAFPAMTDVGRRPIRRRPPRRAAGGDCCAIRPPYSRQRRSRLLVFAAVFAARDHALQPARRSAPVIRFRPPSAQHLFGTDHLGRDIFAIVLYGGRTSLIVGALVTAIAMGAAIVLGLVAGFYRRVDAVLMRIVDGVMAFPGIVLATAATGYLGPSVETVVIALVHRSDRPGAARRAWPGAHRPRTADDRGRPRGRRARAPHPCPLHASRSALADLRPDLVHLFGGGARRSGPELHRPRRRRRAM